MSLILKKTKVEERIRGWVVTMTKKEQEQLADEVQTETEVEVEVATNVAPENDEIAELKAQLAQKEEQIQENIDRLKRLQADFDNFRRRSRQEKEELSAHVTQNIIRELLPLVDNFERALNADNSQEITSFKEGIDMINKQFINILEKNGLEKINCVGEQFDPNFHEAIMRVEDADKEDGTIADELQKGYMVQGKVIRPSMVKVVGN